MQTAKGYTLIELLVGITITTIVFTVGYAGFRDFSRRQALTGVTKMVKADLRQVQQLALTGQKPTTGTCRKLVAYSFDWINNTSYTLNAICDNSLGSSPAIAPPIQLKSVTLTTGVTLAAPATDPTWFKILGQGTNLSAINTLTFTHTATGTTSVITIGIGGEIQ